MAKRRERNAGTPSAPTTSAAPHSIPDPPPSEPGLLRRWIVDPWRYFWLGVTAPNDQSSSRTESTSAGGRATLTEASKEVIKQCTQQSLLEGRPTDIDLWLVLVETAELDSLWRATSTDVGALIAELERLGSEMVAGQQPPRPTMETCVQQTLMHAMGAGMAEVKPHHFVQRLLTMSALGDDDDALVQVLRTVGPEPAMAVRFIAHGVIEHAEWTNENAPLDPMLSVNLVNDDFTTQELVVEILEDIVGLSATDARTAMMWVHRSGEASVAILPRAEAIVLANRVIAHARSAGAPLKASLSVVPHVPVG